MPRRLAPDVLLSIELDAICSRNRYTRDPGPVIAELFATAGDRLDVLTESVGTWVGFFEDAETRTLCTTLRDLPGLEPWIAVGANRRAQPDHRTPIAHPGASWPKLGPRRDQRVSPVGSGPNSADGRPEQGEECPSTSPIVLFKAGYDRPRGVSTAGVVIRASEA